MNTQFPSNGTVTDIIRWLLVIANMLVPLLIAAAIVVFILGVVKFIYKAGDASGREEGRNFMVYGIIGIAVMVSIWGLVAFVTNTLGLPFAIPQLPVR